VSGLPEPAWLDLRVAADKTFAEFPGADPAAVKQALVDALHWGYEDRCDPRGARRSIITKARCPEWHSSNEWSPTHALIELPEDLWDPGLIVRLDWDMGCFERSYGGKTYFFTDIKVERRGLARWLNCQLPNRVASAAVEPEALKDNGATNLLKNDAPVAPDPGVHENGPLVADGYGPPQKKRRGKPPVLTQRVEADMRAAIANGKYTKEALIAEGPTEARATEFGVSRPTIRAALKTLADE
jgi:hypothetical protein